MPVPNAHVKNHIAHPVLPIYPSSHPDELVRIHRETLIKQGTYPIFAGGWMVEVHTVNGSGRGSTHDVPVVSMVQVHEAGFEALLGINQSRGIVQTDICLLFFPSGQRRTPVIWR